MIAPANTGLNSYVDLNKFANNSPPHTPIGPITTISKGITINALRNGTKILRNTNNPTTINVMDIFALKYLAADQPIKIGKKPYKTSPATLNIWIVVFVSDTPASTASFAKAVMKPAANIAGIIGLTIPDNNAIRFSMNLLFLGTSASKFS